MISVILFSPVVSARRLLVGRGDDGPGAPDVEVGLVVGVHGLVLRIREARIRRVPIVHVIAHAGVGHIVRVEAPGDALQYRMSVCDPDPDLMIP